MNIAGVLGNHARNRPSHPAIVDGERVLAYRELHRLVLASAARLSALGVRRGDVVGVHLDHSADHLAMVYALARLGAINLPIEDSLAAPERGRLAERFAPRFVISRGDIGPVGGAETIRFDESWRSAPAPSAPPPLPTDPDLPLLFILTSGSTGQPKATLRTHAQQWHRSMSYSLDSGVSALDCYLGVLDVGLNTGRNQCLAQLMMGGTVVVSHARTANDLVAEVERNAVTWTYIVPAQLRRLAAVAPSGGPLLPRLRLLMTGAAPLYGEERRAIVERVSPQLSIQYGANDCGRFTTLVPEEVLARPLSVGRPHIGVEAQVVDDDHRPLPPGAVGLIRFRSAGYPTAYWRDLEATARNHRDGWFYPGDLAAIDVDGYVYLRGRADDLINYEGLKINPPEVEDVLLAHPGVLEAAVIGWQRGSEQHPVAFVVTRAAINEQALKAFARERLAYYKVPHRILRVDELPRKAMGKLDKEALVARLEQEWDQQPR